VLERFCAFLALLMVNIGLSTEGSRVMHRAGSSGGVTWTLGHGGWRRRLRFRIPRRLSPFFGSAVIQVKPDYVQIRINKIFVAAYLLQGTFLCSWFTKVIDLSALKTGLMQPKGSRERSKKTL
jgi:hypothetical protein